MATKIADFDLDAPLPERVPLGGRARLWALGWRGGVPVGAALIDPEEGGSVSGGRIREALGDVRAEPEIPTPAAPLPPVSVIVCTRNRPDHLPVALASLREQTAPFELVIVDNAPEHGRTRRVVEDLCPEAVYVVEPVPGLPRARNTGIRAASGEVLAFTDDDCRLVPGWVESIARNFAAEPEIGCVTGPILPLELETPAQEAMEARGGFNRGFRRVVYRPDADDGPVYPVQAWRFGAGGSMALSRECLGTVGGFDEALWRSEDIDVFYRALRAGYSLAFEPGAAVRHRHLPDWAQLRRRMFDWGWGYLSFLDKIARSDAPEYAERARTERRNWLRWQLRDRLRPALRGGADLPFPLVLLEIAGGLAGYRGYPIAQSTAARRATARPDPPSGPEERIHG